MFIVIYQYVSSIIHTIYIYVYIDLHVIDHLYIYSNL